MHIFKWISTFLMLSSAHLKKKKNLSGKIDIKYDIAIVKFQAELDINNVEFQNKDILLYNLENRLFDYIELEGVAALPKNSK